ncbi:MAG: histidine--tRNA ligase [Candidatus Shapirobacteria bacterium]
MNQTKLITPVKGTRDFYPEAWRRQLWLSEKWLEVGRLFGYEEYEGPVLESINLYLEKSSQEILEKQTFLVTDRSGDTLVMRPELTPTLARLVAQSEKQLVFPLRWQSYGRFWRYEKPQRGRGREFCQWNIDILGPSSPLVDAEIITIAALALKSIGITPDMAQIKLNDRNALETHLASKLGTSPQITKNVIRAIDKIDKMEPTAFSEWLTELGLNTTQIEILLETISTPSASFSPALTQTLNSVPSELRDYFEIDLKIVRGFDYYTGLVFEAWAKTGLKRSLFGGGRYDNLTQQVGGSIAVPGVGFAIGDMPILELLSELSLIPDLTINPARVLVTTFSLDTALDSFNLASTLRNFNIPTLLYPQADKIGKQFKYASAKNIPYVVVLGPDEIKSGLVTLKNMVTGEQFSLKVEDISSNI